ncbi:MAG: protein kinase [Gemmatimonadaceae bacterium]
MSDPLSRLNAGLAGRYRIARELGSGGMATVFLATDLRHDREVAIKVLHPELGAALGGERFLAEIKVTARLQHPHILPLLDSGETDGLLYYVMPYIAGETLRARLERERQLPIDDALRLAREVADALGAAHALGIVHRDIKPENVLLQGGHALVADFGIALAVQQAGGARMTQTGLSLGTPQYMSPEQAMGERQIDARADVYALGAVTYEMLTGAPPFTGATLQAIVAKVVGAEPESPRLVRKTIPPAVEDALLRSLAKLPADRFATAADFAAALEGGGVPRATAASGPRSATPAARRLSGPVLAVGIAFAALAATGGWWLGRRNASPPSAAWNASILLPDSIPLLPSLTSAEGTTTLAIAPDGLTLALAVGSGTDAQLFVRSVGDFTLRAVAGSVGAQAPFFAPDGASVYFFDDNAVKRLTLADGRITTLHGRPDGVFDDEAWGGTVLPDGTIVVAQRIASELLLLSPTGDSLRTLRCRASCGFPVALPDGRVLSSTGREIYIQDVVNGEITRVTRPGAEGQRVPLYGMMPRLDADGHLGWVTHDGQLLMASFDAQRAEVTSTPEVVAEGVEVENSRGAAQFDLSANGAVAYAPGDVMARGILVRADRTGRIDTLAVAPDAYSGIEVSPDGRRLAVIIDQGESSTVGVIDLESGRMSRWMSGTNIGSIAWWGDGRRLVVVRGDSAFLGDPDTSAPLEPLPNGAVVRGVVYPLTDTAAVLRAIGDTIAQYRNGQLVGGRLSMGGAGMYTVTRDGRWVIGVGLGGADRASVVAHSLTGDRRRITLAPSAYSMGTSVGKGREIFLAEVRALRDAAGERMTQTFYSIAYDPESANPFGRPVKLFDAPIADFPGRNYGVGMEGERFVFKQHLRHAPLREVRYVSTWHARTGRAAP